MPEYVYALHDFTPEHEDEIAFRAGERIEVVEKDDLYGDGWWQGRNLSGKVGLFPKGYTTSTPALLTNGYSTSAETENQSQAPLVHSPTTLQPLQEEPDSDAAPEYGYEDADKAEREGEGDGEVMKATMTDVQKAIEQLGRRNDGDGDAGDARSFSFASTRDGDDITDHESDIDGDGTGEDWHKNARQKLAENARIVAEERAAALEAENAPYRSLAPPIEVEMSDESEDEDDEDHHLTRVTEDDDTQPTTPGLNGLHTRLPTDGTGNRDLVPKDNGTAAAQDLTISARGSTDPQTATRITFPPLSSTTSTPQYPIALVSPGLRQSQPQAQQHEQRNSGSSLPTPVSPASILTSAATDDGPNSPAATDPMSSPRQQKPVSGPLLNDGLPVVAPGTGIGALPSPALSSAAVRSVGSHTPNASTPELQQRKSSSHPSEWSVDEVVEWLKAKGFDQAVCDKFIEQEITGDVLLDLDVNLLKTEIGIAAFGKRMRIANAIAELRRPPSIVYSDHGPSTLTNLNSQFGSGPNSVHQSMTSAQMSGSPLPTITSPESPPHSGDLAGSLFYRGRRDSDPGSAISMRMTDAETARAMAGLGLVSSEMTLSPNGNGKAIKGRPTQLSLSPSDGALGARLASGDQIPEEMEDDHAADDRVVMSESEMALVSGSRTTKSRRRFLGRSTESGSSHDTSRNSKEGSTVPSSIPTSPSKRGSVEDGSSSIRHSKGKRSMDTSKSSEQRLSIFGGSFTGTLGKSRKPPPSYASDDATPTLEKNSRTLSRLYLGHGGKKSSGRPGTADASIPHISDFGKKSKEEELPPSRDPAILRKRTTSAIEPRAVVGVSSLKPGQSILEQIGDSDHNGWMRKKGDRYNTWKLRYFVLKGPHLYYLRSNSQQETRIKGYINIVGYKVIADESVAPGRYGFRIVHDSDKSHYFSSDEQTTVREWMKALMKATIGRDYSKPVVSSCNIPTIPLTVAQAMNPAPRPPSPTARDATQKALRRENPNQLSSRDARVLMGLPSPENNGDVKDAERTRLDSFFTNNSLPNSQSPPPVSPSSVPPRPSRDLSRRNTTTTPGNVRRSTEPTLDYLPVDDGLIEWANSHLPKTLQIADTPGPLCGGLALLRLGESIKGRPCEPPVPDSAFPLSPTDDKLDGLFRLFDFLLDNDIKMGSVSINDVRGGKREKIIQLLRALKVWEEKRQDIARSIGKGSVHAGPFMAMDSYY